MRGRFKKFKEHTTKKGNLFRELKEVVFLREELGSVEGPSSVSHVFLLFVTCPPASGLHHLSVPLRLACCFTKI